MPPLPSTVAPDVPACVYTTLIGGYEALMEQPMAVGSPIPWICLTDDPNLTSTTWRIRHVRPLLPGDPVSSQRDLKIRAHRVLPEFARSLYIDNTVRLTAPAVDLLALLPSGGRLALAPHSFRATVADELDVVAAGDLEDPERLRETRALLAATDPALLAERPWWAGLLLREHLDPAMVELAERWYAAVLRYARRDQLTLGYALRGSGITPIALDLDNHASAWHTWPLAQGRRDAPRPWRAPDAAGPRRAAAEQARDAAQAEAAVLRAERDAALGSTSWALTRPLRAAGSASRRALRRPPPGTPPSPGLRARAGAVAVRRKRGLWYAWFPLVCAVRQRTRGRRVLVAGPDPVLRPYLAWKLAALCGMRIVDDDAGPPGSLVPGLGLRFHDTTASDHLGPRAGRVLNERCRDISKRRVGEMHARVFGYTHAVDPCTTHGPIVQKADANGAKDGMVVTGPLAAPVPGQVYERLIDTEVEPGIVEDLRVTVIGREVVSVFRKRRRIEERFRNVGFPARVAAPLAVFGAGELVRLGELADAMGLDLCEMDVLRDRRDGRIHVVDVNATPYSPPGSLQTLAGLRAMHRAAGAFERSFGRYATPRDGGTPPGAVR
ncbi:MAG: hypothetical protein ACKOTZ_08365 [Chloroflexota bacterium]